MALDFSNRFRKHSFGLANTGGEGIADAAGLSTLPATYASIERKGTDWGEFNSDFLQIQSQEERALESIRTETERRKILHEGYIDALNEVEAAQDNASSKGLFGTLLQAGGMAASLAITSDESTKNTVQDIEDACKLLNKLRPVTFYYNEEFSAHPERMHYGFIAQQYAHVMPDQTYYDESIDKLCIDTNELIAVLVRAIQQLEDRIELLELSHTVLGAK